jgi:predicted  nucleic acid-binding Zn-ribbon protein
LTGMAAPELEALLVLQDRDTAIDRLIHRRETLPERAQLVEARAKAAVISDRLEEARARQAEASSVVGGHERDLAATEARIKEVNDRMYSGAVSASRELQAMAEEVKHLEARKSDLETAALEGIETLEPIDAEVASLEAERATQEKAIEGLEAAITAAEAAIDHELAGERAARTDEGAAVTEGLRTTYEQLRKLLGGVGAARLQHGSCSGCHLTLSATELDQLKRQPADALVYCEQCGRILVRAADG